VFLPLEAHHYSANESLQHMLWEENRWLDTYVKPAASNTLTAGKK
jgi:dipeptidyl aminopeptidase/acylaminoacyl peptidase